MNALRMVWIISRYYSDDMRMGALFKRIGQEIGDRVEAAIDVKVWYDYIARHKTASLVTVVKLQVGIFVCKTGWSTLLRSQLTRDNLLPPPPSRALCQGLASMPQAGQ